jgi:hypothetical protein
MERRMDNSAANPPGLQRQAERRAIWIALLIITGVGSSFFFACATPFAAVATLASLRLDRREAVAAVGLVWLANQAIGYGILGYPWTLDSAAWGVAIGLSGYLALLAATALTPAEPARLATSLPFMGAFATYELGLYVAGFVLPGGNSAFTGAIIAQVFAVNLIALIGLLGAYQLTLAIRPPWRGRVQPPIALLPR